MADACMEVVRQWDRDRYLSALFAPDDTRTHLFALYAFDAEIARIHAAVSEPQIGEIRLQWWLDTIEAIEKGQSIDHPIAQRFAETVKAFALPTKHLANLIEARRSELYADSFPNAFSLESYIAETEAALMQCAAIILDREMAAKHSARIGTAATALGLARLLQQPQLLKKFMPPSETTESLKQLALKRLAEARRDQIPASIFPAVLQVALTEHYLNGATSQLRRQWWLWRAARSGKL
jgi:15-cis-phytoene synthase